MRPYIRYFDSSTIQVDPSNGDICLALAKLFILQPQPHAIKRGRTWSKIIDGH